MANDNPEYEWARDRVADPAPYPGQPENEYETARDIATEKVRGVMSSMAYSCGMNGERMIVLCLRYGGLSYNTIGARLGITKQAVSKHIAYIASRNRDLGQMLRNQPEKISVEGQAISVESFLIETEAKHRKATQWMQRKN